MSGYGSVVHLSRAEYWCYFGWVTSFEYIAGDPALDFVNTADWTGAGPIAERLGEYDDLVRWGMHAGLVPQRVAARLRRRALARPRDARAALRAARSARDVLQGVFEAVAASERPGPALAELNALVGPALGRLQLRDTSPRRVGARAGWDWLGMEQRLDSVLWPVIRAAADLLASDEAGQVRVCGGPDCGWMYVDRSRNGLRRWCQMRTCGTREKSRRRRAG